MSTSAAHVSNSAKLGTVRLRIAARTDVGRRRSENQDSYGYVHTTRSSLYVVADGMGGARGGGTASAMAVQLIIDGAIDSQGGLSLESLHNAIELSNRVIFSRSQRDAQFTGMGTTVVALAFVEDKAIVAHVGDSRIYMLRDGNLHQLTRDHTLVQELVDTGAIPPQDAASHPIAHMLTRSLGPTEAIGVEIHPLPDTVRPGDKFLLCSDGLYNHVENDELFRVLTGKSTEEAADELLNLALEGGGTDNVTLQVIEVLDTNDAGPAAEELPNGQVDRFISSEIDVREFDGTTLLEFARSLNGAEEIAAKSGAQPDATATNGTDHSAQQTTAADDDTEPTRRSERVYHPETAEDDRPSSVAGESRGLDAGGASFQVAAPRPVGLAVSIIALMSLAGYILYSVSAPTHPDVIPNEHAVQTQPSGTPVNPDAPQAQPPLQPPVDPSADPSALDAMQKEMVAWEPKPEGSASTEVTEPPPPSGDPGSEQIAKVLEQTTEAPVADTIVDEPTVTEKRFSDLLVLASDIRVQPAPRLSLGGGNRTMQPDQPIIWEHESKLVKNILKGMPLPNTKQPEVETPESPKLRTPEEIQELAEQKAQLRDRIGDIDAKLELLVLEKKEQAQNKQTRLEMEAARNNEAMLSLQQELAAAVAALENWEKQQKKAADSEALKLADEIALLSDNVRGKRAAYQDATESYMQAVDKWQSDTKDPNIAPQMAALGREVKAKRLELEVAVSNAMTTGLALARTRVQRLRFNIANLQRHRDRLNRQIGLLRAFLPDTVARKQDLQKKYLEDRGLQLKNLNQLRTSLPDEAEVEFRVQNAELFGSV